MPHRDTSMNNPSTDIHEMRKSLSSIHHFDPQSGYFVIFGTFSSPTFCRIKLGFRLERVDRTIWIRWVVKCAKKIIRYFWGGKRWKRAMRDRVLWTSAYWMNFKYVSMHIKKRDTFWSKKDDSWSGGSVFGEDNTSCGREFVVWKMWTHFVLNLI